MCAERTDIVDFFQKFPHETAMVLQRSVELSAVLTSLLGAHCAVLACQFSSTSLADPEGMTDSIIRGLCVVRVACMVPRPYWWLQERSRFVAAQSLPTPQQLARRLQEIQSSPRRKFASRLRTLYYSWLAFATIIVCLIRITTEPTALSEQAWRQLIFNFVCMGLHRMTCMVLFYRLTCSKIQRGISGGTLDACSVRLQYTEDVSARGDDKCDVDECSICLCAFSAGEEVRTLSCKHRFHCRCLDPWLVQRRNQCPLCLAIVGAHR